MNSFHACSWTKRQRRNNKSAKLKEVQAWQNGTYIVGTWPEQQRELEKDQHKPHGYRPSECQVSVVNPRFALRSINKELIFFSTAPDWAGKSQTDKKSTPDMLWHHQERALGPGSAMMTAVTLQSAPSWSQLWEALWSMPSCLQRVSALRSFSV